MIWHNSTPNDVINELNSNVEKGLYTEAAQTRLETYGKNEINSFSEKNFLHYLKKEIKSVLNIALVVLSIIFMIVCTKFSEAGLPDAIIIILIVLGNIALSSYGNYKRNREFNRLKGSVLGKATVIRNGEETVIPAAELVPGDIMLIKTGDYIMADARLIDSYVLKCDEFKLTGESVPADKIHDVLFEDITPLENRQNMVYCGTSVVNGKATAIVTETGLSTEIGKVKKIEKHITNSKTQLEQKLTNVGRYAFFIAIVLAVIIFPIGTIINFSSSDFAFATTFLRYILLGFAICFCAAGKVLPSVFSLNLTASVRRLEKQNVVITNIKSIDDIKDVNVICTDKTGSLTTGDMTVKKIFVGKIVDAHTEELDESASTVIRLALICSNFDRNEHIEKHANNVELAIEKACMKHMGMSKIDIDGIYPKLAEIPFDSERMLMTTVSAIEGTPYSIVKGAPEVIGEKCSNISSEQLKNVADSFASEGLKVIAVAFKTLEEIPANINPDELENDLVFAGLIGIEDSADLEAIALCQECKENGIKIIMLTGDHLSTALATAKNLGIAESDEEAISGEVLAEMSDGELSEKINAYSVFARITPEDKLRIVTALKSAGNNVAITGDTVNDTPALLAANVGCALGMTASDMVKDSADIVITDNRFVSLISALKETNKMHNTVIKTTGHFFSANAAQVLVLLLGLIIFGISPIAAAALLVIGVLSSLAYFGLALDDVQQPLSEKKSLSLLNKNFLISSLVPTVITAALALVAFGICKAAGNDAALTATFAVIVVCNMVNSFKLCFDKSALSADIIKHNYMSIAVGITLFVLLLLVVTPVGKLVSLGILNSTGWLMILISLVVSFFADELTKLILKKYF